mgnify:CR=1 FL=1
MDNKIYSVTLKRSTKDNRWLATYNDPAIIKLFNGESTITTAFFATTPLDVVVKFMKNYDLAKQRGPDAKFDVLFEGEVQ